MLIYSTRTHDHTITFQRRSEIARQMSVHMEECNREEQKAGPEEGERGHGVSAHALKRAAFTAEQLYMPVLGGLSIPGMSFGLPYFCRQTTKMFCANLTRQLRERQLQE